MMAAKAKGHPCRDRSSHGDLSAIISAVHPRQLIYRFGDDEFIHVRFWRQSRHPTRSEIRFAVSATTKNNLPSTYVRLWHKADVPLALTNVCYLG
jgi:hypothetical protein